MKNDFSPFSVGKVFNQLKLIGESKPLYRSITIKYPSRLNAMALDPSKIAMNDNLCYSPGEIIFKINIFKEVTVSLSESDDVSISFDSKRPAIKTIQRGL